MGFRVLVGALLSAVVLMLWSFLFWVVLSGPGGNMRPLPQEAQVTALLRESLPASGAYAFPMPEQGPDMRPAAAFEAFRKRSLAGPTGVLLYQRQGSDPVSPRVFLVGFVQFFCASLLVGVLMAVTVRSLDSYVRRVVFVFLLGLFAVVAVGLWDPIWWRLPWGHYLYAAVYYLVAWLLAGLVLAGIVRPGRGFSMTDQTKPLWKRALESD